MKLRSILVLIIFSAIIVVVGGICKLFHWQGAEFVLTTGLLMETVSLLLLIFRLGEQGDRPSYPD